MDWVWIIVGIVVGIILSTVCSVIGCMLHKRGGSWSRRDENKSMGGGSKLFFHLIFHQIFLVILGQNFIIIGTHSAILISCQ